MSEVITGGVAAAAVGACTAAVGAAVVVGYVTYRGLIWLSSQAKREMERLENELASPLVPCTTVEAQKEFGKRFAFAYERAAKNPALKNHADATARILAFKGSPLASFVDQSQWKNVCDPALNPQLFSDILNQAGARFTKANAMFVGQSIIEVAKENGFTDERSRQTKNSKQILVMADHSGRSLVAHVGESDEGATITLDLTGFGDAGCHSVMDNVLDGLSRRDIDLRNLNRRSHYRREGVLSSTIEQPESNREPAKQVYSYQERREADARRRRTHFATILKVKS